jgi:hypothetical protein
VRFCEAAAVGLLTTLIAAPCLGVCAGWSASHHERMACCADKAENEADACCASGEAQQSTDGLLGPVTAIPSPVVDAERVESILAASQIFTPHWNSHDRAPADSHRYIRLSVFLI